MEKSIKMSEETWKKLNKYKYQFGAKSIDDVIQTLIKVTSEIKLASELKKLPTKK